MSNILKKEKSKVTSKVRAWAERQNQLDQEDQSIIKTLSNSIIYGLCSFCSSPDHLDEKGGFLNEESKKILSVYSGDASLFELGCYLHFRIDLWHVQNVKEQYREGVAYKYLIRKFIEIFEDALKLENSNEILQNRLTLYGNLIRKKPERIQFYLLQLVSRTKNNTLPEIHDFDNFPVMISGIVEEKVLEIEIESFDRVMVPICCNNLKTFYETMSVELKRFLLDSE